MAVVALAVALVVVAVAVAAVLQRNRVADAPTQPSWDVPAQLDRSDFPGPGVAWLVVVFSSATCDTCAAVVAAAQVLAGPDVEVVEVEAAAAARLHRRYGIEAVPITVVADAGGVVQASVVGPVGAGELGALLARCRDGGPDQAAS